MIQQSSTPMTTITFDLPIIPHLLRKLRGAIIESVMQHKAVFEAAEIPTQVFHNHTEPKLELAGDIEDLPEQEETNDRTWDYPKVQYKVRHKKAEIMGIGQGAQAVQLWVSLVGDTITVNGQKISLTVRSHTHSQWKPELQEKPTLYRLNKWLPLSAKNYDKWQNTPKLADKVKILDNILWGHISHLMQGLKIELDKTKLELYTSTIDMQTYKACYNIKKLALDITFYTNLNLPEEIGLGQGVTIGFGKVQSIKKRNRKE